MTTTRVRAHERVRDGKQEHVREHSRRVSGSGGSTEEPNPEDYGEILEEQREGVNTNVEKKPENPRPERNNNSQGGRTKPENKREDK